MTANLTPTPTREAVEQARADLLYQASWKEGDLLVKMLDALLALFDAPPRGEAVAFDKRVDPLTDREVLQAFDCVSQIADGADATATEFEYIQNYGKDPADVRAVVLSRAKVSALPVPPAGTREALERGLDWAKVEALLVDVCQLLDGWHADGTAWSEWDESVRQRVAALLHLVYADNAARGVRAVADDLLRDIPSCDAEKARPDTNFHAAFPGPREEGSNG